jgi:acyl-CoA reductase-like NAD-dependent aldehyde dehydrogenase
MRFPAHHLPGLAPSFATRVRPFGSHAAESAVLSPADLERALADADAAADRVRARPAAERLASLRAVADLWSDPERDPAAAARRIVADGTGYSEPVVRRGLDAIVAALRDDAVGALLDRELGTRPPFGPRRITHVMSGNLPGLSFAPVTLSLALGSAVLVKSAEGDPYSPAAFAASIAAIDADLGHCIVVHDWRGGDTALEAVAFAADVVVAFGSDATIASIAGRVRGRFFGHGHKISFALVGREALVAPEEVARRLAFDVALWDQQGCLSPQLCFVEGGGAIDVDGFADALAVALAQVATELPPRRLGFDEQAAIGAFRQEAEWNPGSPADRLLAAHDTAWTVSVEHRATFRPTCLNRCIRVIAIDDAAALPSLLEPHRSHLECAGLATGSGRHDALEAMLHASGVHRVCAVGSMQLPDLSWRQGGGPRVRDWLEPDGREG